jgi:tRNA-Thr(GGU) m(6)t(6)A37 methyltransferase TsaA
MSDGLELRVIGRVRSPLRNLRAAPMQADEGAPPAWLVFDDAVAEALKDLRPGEDALLLTWLDQADREVLAVHPRDDRTRPLTGVFSTRSPDRPNPIGLHRVTVTAREDNRIQVQALEALDGTPIIDVKAVLGADDR